jgi:hypothetical protein
MMAFESAERDEPTMFDAIKRLFGGGGTSSSSASARGVPEIHKDFTITPAPRKQGSQWLTAGFIAKEGPDGMREAEFIRSDQFTSREEAETCALAKGRQIIDEQGDRLFDREWP